MCSQCSRAHTEAACTCGAEKSPCSRRQIILQEGKQCREQEVRSADTSRGRGLRHTHTTARRRDTDETRPRVAAPALHFVNKGEKCPHSHESRDAPVTFRSLKWYVHKSSKGNSRGDWLTTTVESGALPNHDSNSEPLQIRFEIPRDAKCSHSSEISFHC